MKRTRSIVFVTVQFTLIFTIAWYAGVWGGVAQNILMLVSIALGLWAIITMRFSVNIFPDVRAGQQLYTGGPYRLIRHPMYTAVLLATGAWALNRPDMVSGIMWVLLLIELLLKLRYEEVQLHHRFAEYAAYMRRTKRLLPFIY